MDVFKNILDEIETIKKDRMGELSRRLKVASNMRDPAGKILPEAKEESLKVFFGIMDVNKDIVDRVNTLMYFTGKAVLNMTERIDILKEDNRQYKRYLKTKQLGKDFRNFKKITDKKVRS